MQSNNRFVKTLLLVTVISVLSVDCGGKGGLMKGLLKKGGIFMLGGRMMPMPMPMPIPIPMIHDNHHHAPCPPPKITHSSSHSIGGHIPHHMGHDMALDDWMRK